MSAKPRVNLVLGATNYSFELAGPVRGTKKPDSGEIQKTVALQRRGDQLDAPWSMSNFTGLGVSRAVEAMEDADNRFFEGMNIQHWPGMWCLGPLGRTTTDITGVHRIRGFFQYPNNLFYFSDLPSSGTGETIATWAATGTWTDATATADFNTTAGANSGFPCVGMAQRTSSVGGTNANRIYALRQSVVQNGAAFYQLMYSTNGTTWTPVDHTSAANSPSGAASVNAAGLIEIAGFLYTAVRDANNALLLRRSNSADGGVTWATAATADEGVTSDPATCVVWYDYAGSIRPVVFTNEGVYIYDGTSLYRFIDHVNQWGENQTMSPAAATVWYVNGGPEGGYLAYGIGRAVRLLSWGNNNTPIPIDISPDYLTQGLPTVRAGRVTALAAIQGYLWASIGGDSSSTTGGIYVRDGKYLHPRGWFGPIYDVATANRQVRALGFSAFDDGVPRLMMGVDNGTADDTDPLYFDNVTRDPRTVSSYLHAASGRFILPKNDRFLPELTGRWRQLEAVGTGLTSSNKITDVFVSADAAPLASNGPWGTTLGEIPTNAGTLNFSATPSGTGQNSRAVQLRIDLEGASNASPYIETVNVYVKKNLPVKYIRVFPISLKQSGVVRPIQAVLDELETVVDAATDFNVTYGEETTAIVMEPYRFGDGPIRYGNRTRREGTVNEQGDIDLVELVLVNV